MKSVRESNYELLRIVSMFFIVAWHVIIHGNLLTNTVGNLNIIMNALELFFIVHVSVFMLITGYFQSKSRFRFKKLISLILEIWFYNFFINTFLYLSGIVEYSSADYLSKIMFYNYSSYWYIQFYIVVYLVSPYLNKIIDFCSRKELKKLIIIMFCCFSIIPAFTFSLAYYASGSSLDQYILLYFIGAYIRKYDIVKTFLSKFSISKKRLIYISIYLLAWLLNVGLFYLSLVLSNKENSIIQFISSFLQTSKFYYSKPLVIIQSLSIFLLFGTFHFKCRLVNIISRLTLGVYFIHEAAYIRSNIYVWFGIDGQGMIFSRKIIIKIFLVALAIFIGCSLIEFMREKIFLLLSKTKFFKKIDKKIDPVFERLEQVK